MLALLVHLSLLLLKALKEAQDEDLFYCNVDNRDLLADKQP